MSDIQFLLTHNWWFELLHNFVFKYGTALNLYIDTYLPIYYSIPVQQCDNQNNNHQSQHMLYHNDTDEPGYNFQHKNLHIKMGKCYIINIFAEQYFFRKVL